MEFEQRIANAMGIEQRAASCVIKTVLQCVCEGLQRKKFFVLHGLGKFIMKKSNLPDHDKPYVKFIPTKDMLAFLNSGEC